MTNPSKSTKLTLKAVMSWPSTPTASQKPALEEYGEGQPLDTVTENRDLSANALIQVVRGVKTLVGNHPQHDDITMVVIKVRGKPF